MNSNPKRVWLIEDNKAYRDSLERAVHCIEGIECSGDFEVDRFSTGTGTLTGLEVA